MIYQKRGPTDLILYVEGRLLTKGFLEFSTSKSLSKAQMNATVAANSFNFRTVAQYSIASAALKLKVTAAKLTFIFVGAIEYEMSLIYCQVFALENFETYEDFLYINA